MRAEIGDLDGEPRSGVDSATMILSCPHCATDYFVDEARLGPGGRSVKCGACGSRWTALPSAVDNEPQAGPKPGGGGAEFPKQFRAKVSLQRRWREAALAGAAMGAAVVLVAVLAGSAVIYRNNVARVLPGAARIYAAMGMPVNRLGLVIEGVRAEPTLQDGHAALAVSGVIRNIESRSIASPPLHIALYNGQGRRVDGRIATASDLRIAPGAKRRFAVAIIDPPLGATNLEVGFALGAVGKGPLARQLSRRSPSAPPSPALKGPIEPEASPTPSTGSNVSS
jgi:predicted Zn finger-like uncharacterized protein